MKRRALLRLLVAGFAGAALARARASEVSPESVAQAVNLAQPGLQLTGQGSLRFLGLKIYDARLWLPRNARLDALFERPFALDLRYARGFKGVDVASRSRQEMEKLEIASPDRLRVWEDRLAKVFPDLRTGDHLTGLHRPGRGALFLYNGRTLAEIEGDDFSRAFFSIWLDARTSAPALRTALLGSATP